MFKQRKKTIKKKIDKNNYRIESVYSNLTGNTVKAVGDKLTGLCPNPTHHDNNIGNFFIYPDTNSCYCFACDFGGDAVNLVQGVKNITYSEALDYLKSGDRFFKPSDVNYTIPKSAEPSQKTLEIYSFLFDQLDLTVYGLNYLKTRGLTSSTASDFKITSNDYPDELYACLRERFSLEELLAAGLAGISKTGKEYFVFYLSGIIFTVFENDQPVYFISRVYPGEESKLRYVKLHGIKQRYMTGNLDDDEILILEGPMDALSYYQLSGKTNFVVIAGLNNNIVTRIKNSFPDKKLVLGLDNDKAGNEAKDRFVKSSIDNVEVLNYEALTTHLGIPSSCNYKDFNDILLASQKYKKVQ